MAAFCFCFRCALCVHTLHYRIKGTKAMDDVRNGTIGQIGPIFCLRRIGRGRM